MIICENQNQIHSLRNANDTTCTLHRRRCGNANATTPLGGVQELNEGKHNECNIKTDRLNKSDGLDFSFIPKIQINRMFDTVE